MRLPASLPLLVFLIACLGEPEPEWIDEGNGIRSRELTTAEGSGQGFTALNPARTGIQFVNDPDPRMLTRNQHLANGAGVAIGDVNDDGLADVFLVHTDGRNALFLSRGGMRWQSAGEGAGVAMPGTNPTGAAFADVDGDGDLDLLVSALGSSVSLFVNSGKGSFTDGSAAAGFDLSRAGSTLTLADIDADGDLDLYAANYRLWQAAHVFSPAERATNPVVRDLPDGSVEVSEMYRDYYEIVSGPDDATMTWEFGEEDDLWLNDGSGHFTREGIVGPRFTDVAGDPVSEEPREWGLSARFRDVDGDGDPDLYVANDFESPDQLWINDGRGRFRQLGGPALRKTSHASMSVAFGDVDGNGLVDIFVADMLPLSMRRRKTQVPMLREIRPPSGDTASVMQVNRNTLLLARPGGGYDEVARWAGVDASGWTWGTEMLDADLDGDLDLVAATGHRWDPLDGDTAERMRAMPTGTAVAGADWRDVINAFPELRLSNAAFRNLGDGRYERVDSVWGFDVGPDVSHGLATGDLDGDGDLDIVINRLDDPALVLRNNVTAGRLAVRLLGSPPNTGAVGAVVSLMDGPGPSENGPAQRNRISHEVGAGGLYLSHSEQTVSFAASDSDSLTLIVRWPSGGVTKFDGARGGHLYEIHEVGAAEAPGDRDEAKQGPGAETPTPQATPVPAMPLFEDVSGPLGHTHRDAPFPSPAQPLVPRNLSDLGPGIAWADVDRDGDPDLAVGGGAGGELVVIENRNGIPGDGLTMHSPSLDYDVSGIISEPDGSLLVGLANWEAPSVQVARSLPPARRVRVRDGTLELTPILSSDGSSTGPIISADIDGDLDLDVFVGGRAYQGAYPIPPKSRIFLRENDGSLRHDSAISAPIADAGLVSGAVFTDLDSDGDPDLALALDWGAPRVFRNDGGKFVDQTAALGLASQLGWWNGVTAGDMNSDGRMDLVLTSWGTNTGLSASPTRPIVAHWADFDRGGTLDVLLAQLDDHIGDEVLLPSPSYLEIASVLPYVRVRTTLTFGAYADASLAEVLGPTARTARTERVTTLEHTMFINQGTRFEPVPLPAAAQRAPAHGVAVADLNGDGHEDIALAQNFFPDRTGRERHDGGRGLIILGDGEGGLLPLGSDRSGISLSGDQRGLAVADFNADGRADLAIGQHSGPVALFRNLGGREGLRVSLSDGPENPYGIGATVWAVYADGERGPSREVRSGSGFWSSDEPVPLLGPKGEVLAIYVRWPGGDVAMSEIGTDARRVVLRRDSGIR